jgi:hypothetical protein
MFAACESCLATVVTSEAESTRDRRRGRVQNPSAVRSGWTHRTRLVQLKVPHVVLHLERPPAPPLLGIGAAHGTDYPPSTSCVRVVGSVLI